MDDITILFLTLNKVPKKYAEYQKEVLLKAARGASIITISKEPLDWGINILQTEKESISNIYWQMLKGAKMATTEYIAIAEDNALYHEEHFCNRPKEDEFGYNMTVWSLFNWDTPIFSREYIKNNYSMICSRKLLIETLEERFTKYPNGTPEDLTKELGLNGTESNLGLTERKSIEFWTTVPIINFCYDSKEEEYKKNHTKRIEILKTYEVPFWGRAENLVAKFK